jgi:hypothetical protein
MVLAPQSVLFSEVLRQHTLPGDGVRLDPPLIFQLSNHVIRFLHCGNFIHPLLDCCLVFSSLVQNFDHVRLAEGGLPRCTHTDRSCVSFFICSFSRQCCRYIYPRFWFCGCSQTYPGWKSAQILVTLILSVVLFGVFLFIEYYVKHPALPMDIWTPRFTPLFLYGLSVFWYAFGGQILTISLFTVSLTR